MLQYYSVSIIFKAIDLLDQNVINKMVNTFFVDENVEVTAKVLDYKRLGKQRVEAMQIIKVLSDPNLYVWVDKDHGKTLVKTKIPWSNHPATIMWQGYLNALKYYFNVMTQEWVAQGYKNTIPLYEVTQPIEMPPWSKWKCVHYSHQASLTRKDPKFYMGKFSYPEIYNTIGYIWPSHVNDEYSKYLNAGYEVAPDTIAAKITAPTVSKKKPKERIVVPDMVPLNHTDITSLSKIMIPSIDTPTTYHFSQIVSGQI